MAIKAWGEYNNNSIINFYIDGDGSSTTFKWTVASGIIDSLFGGVAPNKCVCAILQDNGSQGLSINSSPLTTALGVTTCIITFNKAPVVSDPVNGPLTLVQAVLEYASE